MKRGESSNKTHNFKDFRFGGWLREEKVLAP